MNPLVSETVKRLTQQCLYCGAIKMKGKACPKCGRDDDGDYDNDRDFDPSKPAATDTQESGNY